jgi:hypothetical protein
MKRKFVIVVSVFLLACSSASSRASSANRIQDPELSGALGRELTRNVILHEESRGQSAGKPQCRHQATPSISFPQNDLLLELLAAGDTRKPEKPEVISFR